MTALPFHYTPEQQELLDQNAYFIPAAIFDDGDILILDDAGPMGGRYEGSHIAKYYPWVLTRDGEIQGISWHYQNRHDLASPLEDRHPLEPGPDLEIPDRLLITLETASAYLASAYDIRIGARTIRNWCADGRIACRRFSKRQNAPWHTTTRALDAIAAEWVDGVHVRGPGSADADPEEDSDGLR